MKLHVLTLVPTISLAYTSRRAGMIESVVTTWKSKAGNVPVEIVLAVDADYAAGIDVGKKLLASGKISRLAINDGPKDCVAGWNKAAEATTGEIIIALADDFSPPNAWAEALIGLVPGWKWWEEDRTVWVSDGYSPDLQTLAIISRKRYQRFGYVFYPGYSSLFSDTEHTAVANLERATIDARHLLFEHMHPDCGKRDRDLVDLTHASTDRWKRGEMIFNYRKSVGFPIDAGPMAQVYDSETQVDYALYVQAIKDDIALFDVCARIIEEGKVTPNVSVKKVYLCVPDEYWSGRQTTPEERGEIIAVSDRLNKAFGPEVQTVVFSIRVAGRRAAGKSRIDVETDVRNDSVQAIRKHSGLKHVLIADGDELWLPGLLGELSGVVRERNPAGVFTGMVPVVGLPGYAVNEALDKASIYIGPGTFFTDCRGTSGFRHDLPGYRIIHFTATRPTMEEIVSKHRESGHYDDKSYVFEDWIRDTLPKIGIESKNLHMWKGPNGDARNIWPSVRWWTQEEWESIPETLKKFLATPRFST